MKICKDFLKSATSSYSKLLDFGCLECIETFYFSELLYDWNSKEKVLILDVINAFCFLWKNFLILITNLIVSRNSQFFLKFACNLWIMIINQKWWQYFLVQGNWSQWNNWTECDQPCGTGSRNRSRNCDNPPPGHGGDNCTGNATDVQSCNVDPCPSK